MKEFSLTVKKHKNDIPVFISSKKDLPQVTSAFTDVQKAWIASAGFRAEPGAHLLIADGEGKCSAVLFGAGADENGFEDAFALGALPARLPEGRYRLANRDNIEKFALAWGLGGYQFSRYKKPAPRAVLAMDKTPELQRICTILRGVYLARDLVNTPANDMGPAELEAAARKLAASHKAKIKLIKGDELLKQNLPLVYAVGKASVRAPRMIDISWGVKDAPKVTIIGKGVCFDTGGLDIKPSGAMALMKKDMGGAANALGLAAMIMAAKLPLRLRVLVPAVENSISGEAFRPGDIYPSRKGLSVEIGNTDAEGRLVLADALAMADEEKPDLLISLATLTGAARVALGPDLPPFYTHDADMAEKITNASIRSSDPLWQMPLWPAYDKWLASPVADLNHITSQPFAGSITAALFLNRFVERRTSYAHFDIFAWTPEARPGCPKGGEAQAIRALFTLLEDMFV